MTDPEVTYECNECSQEFGKRQEIEEHLVEVHDIFDRFITVDDPSNRAEPEGL